MKLNPRTPAPFAAGRRVRIVDIKGLAAQNKLIRGERAHVVVRVRELVDRTWLVSLACGRHKYAASLESADDSLPTCKRCERRLLEAE